MLKDEISDLLEHFSLTRGQPTNVRPLLSPSMSNNMAVLMFGKRRKYDDPIRIRLDKILHKGAEAGSQAAWHLFFPWIGKALAFFNMGPKAKIGIFVQEFKNYVWEEIEEHDVTLDRHNIRDYIDGYLVEIRRRNDPAFCKKVLLDMVGVFFGAGSETVRLALDWLLLIMASHPDVQIRVQTEIDQVVGRTRLPSWKDHSRMPYTQAVIMEFMRWRTLIPLNILRYTLADAQLNGYFIPKSTIVVANLYAVHQDPTYWGDDVDAFRPERFLSADKKEIVEYEHFIPFSIGKRDCPGKSFAKMEVFLYFVSILQNFKLSLPESILPNFDSELGVGLTPKPYDLCLNQRT